MIARSIRWRFQAWLAFLLAAALVGFGVALYQLQRGHLRGEMDERLAQRVSVLDRAVRPEPPPMFALGYPGPSEFVDLPPWEPPRRPFASVRHPVRITDEVLELFPGGGRDACYGSIWYRDGAVAWSSTNRPADLVRPALARDALIHMRVVGGLREAFHFTEMGDCVLAGCSTRADREALRRFAGWLALGGLTILGLGLGGGWWLITRALRPIENISAAAAKIAAGDLAQRIDPAGADNELGRLVGVLNSTFSRLDAAFAQQARFTADAAHELRTPVSVVLTHTQNGLSSPCVCPGHRAAFEACERSARRMRRIIESLLHLARLDAGQEPLRREPFDLAAVVRDSVELILPLAGPRGLDLRHDLRPAPCSGDAERLGQVITNLLANAIQYTPSGGRVDVSVRAEGDTAILEVADNGAGIPVVDLPNVFKRFHRADPSRPASSGQSGLGLAISKAIVEAHGGSIAAANRPGGGAVFTVRLPIAPSTDRAG